MKPIKKFANKIKSKLSEKQDDMLRIPATFGDVSGNVKVAGQLNFNYVTIGNNVSVVFNNRVPAQAGVKIWVGYASEDQTNVNGKKAPKRFQVLSTRSETPSDDSTQMGGFAPAIRYEKGAVGGGQDPLNVQLRQFMPLSLNVKSGMTVDLYRGYVWNLTEHLAVARQDIDLTAYIPTTTGKAALVLIAVDASGLVTKTKGAEVDIAALTLSDLPEVPTGTMFVSGAVRVYYGQTAVQDARSNTDIVDLRLSVGGYGVVESGGVKSLFFTKTASDVGGMYKALHALPTNTVQTITATAADGETVIASFIEDVNTAPYRVTEGTRFFHLIAKTSSVTKPTQLRGYVYQCDVSGGTPILLRTSTLSLPLTVLDAEYSMSVWGSSLVIPVTMRIKFVISVVKTGTGLDPTITLSVDDDTFSRLDVPSPVGVTDIPATIHASPSKTTPIDADEFALVDTADDNLLKRLTWANIKATAKTYFDTLYLSLASMSAANALDLTDGGETILHTHGAATVTGKAPLVFGGHGNGGTVPASTTYYICPYIAGLDTVGRTFPIPVGGTLKNFYFKMGSSQPASGSLVLTIYDGTAAAATPITITVPAGSVSTTIFSDLVHTYAYTAGNLIRVNIVNNATGASGVIGGVSFELDAALV